MECGSIYSRGKSRNGGVKRVNFAHYRTSYKGRTAEELNVHPLISYLVNGKMATLYELQTIYNFADLFILKEILDIQLEAEYIAAQKRKRKSKSG